MSSFSCPHYDDHRDACERIGDVCVPGRPGCVLCRNSVFAVPWQQRLAAKRQSLSPEPRLGGELGERTDGARASAGDQA